MLLIVKAMANNNIYLSSYLFPIFCRVMIHIAVVDIGDVVKSQSTSDNYHCALIPQQWVSYGNCSMTLPSFRPSYSTIRSRFS